jgi:hypothetical protein
VPIRRATALGQINFGDLYTLLELVGKNPAAAERHLQRMGSTANEVRAEIEGRKAMQAIKAAATVERRRREEDRMAMEREAWKAAPVGRQAVLVESLADDLQDALKDGGGDAGQHGDVARRLDEAQRRLDEMTGRRSRGEPRKLAGAPTAHAVFHGSYAAATRAYYRRLSGLGFDGRLAAQLMRVQKSSSRAKLYRGEHGGHAYRNKEEAMAGLTALMAQPGCGLKWGWGEDDSPGRTHPCRHVLYVDLPTGQVSFHAMARGAGPDYGGAWDGALGVSEGRIVKFAAMVEKDASASPLDVGPV